MTEIGMHARKKSLNPTSPLSRGMVLEFPSILRIPEGFKEKSTGYRARQQAARSRVRLIADSSIQ